jgi:hypothetical protein
VSTVYGSNGMKTDMVLKYSYDPNSKTSNTASSANIGSFTIKRSNEPDQVLNITRHNLEQAMSLMNLMKSGKGDGFRQDYGRQDNANKDYTNKEYTNKEYINKDYTNKEFARREYIQLDMQDYMQADVQDYMQHDPQTDMPYYVHAVQNFPTQGLPHPISILRESGMIGHPTIMILQP